MKKYSKGFTLIELLVVIAIIGILSSVVLASLNTARNKGSDAAAKAGYAQLRNAAELFYDGGSTYEGFLASTSAAAILTNIGTNITGTTSSGDSLTKWAASSALKGGGFWCADNTGTAKATGIIALDGQDGVCDGTAATQI
jgi:type IV pilus assembly protein PilE